MKVEERNNDKAQKEKSESFDPFKFKVKDQIPEDIYVALCDYEGYLENLEKREKH